MSLSVKNRGLFYLYATIIFVMMCISNRTLYTNHIPDTFVMFLGIIQLVFFMMFLGGSKHRSVFMLFLCIGIMILFSIFNYSNNSIYRVIINFGVFFSISSVLLLSNVDKKALLDFLSKVLFCILTISLVGWICHLVGYTPPVFDNVDFNNDVHNLNNHFVYYDIVDLMATIFPRFRGIFIEPGQLATPCVFLFFARGAKITDKINILLLLAILFSFSLVGYMVLIVGLFLNYLFVQGKYRIAKLLGYVLLLGLISFYLIKNANKDNPFTTLIIERLEYDEDLGISGNNRSDDLFDYNYDQFVRSDKIILGMGDEIKISNTSWTNHASGIKKFFVYYGLLGVVNMVLLTLLLLKVNYCRSTLVFFVVIWLSFLVRDMLQTHFWLTLTILGFYNLKRLDVCIPNDTRLVRNDKLV